MYISNMGTHKPYINFGFPLVGNNERESHIYAEALPDLDDEGAHGLSLSQSKFKFLNPKIV